MRKFARHTLKVNILASSGNCNQNNAQENPTDPCRKRQWTNDSSAAFANVLFFGANEDNEYTNIRFSSVLCVKLRESNVLEKSREWEKKQMQCVRWQKEERESEREKVHCSICFVSIWLF